MKITSRLFAAAYITASLLAACLANATPEVKRPQYPLYSPFFGDEHQFSPEDLRGIAENFDFVYGQSLQTEDMNKARALAPNLKFLRYTGNWSVRGSEAESNLRTRILYYLAAKLDEDISPDARVFTLQSPAQGKELLFKPSTASGDLSTDGSHYVTWLRIDDELMRIEAWDPASRRITVRRGFDSSKPSAHTRSSPVLHPAYSSVPGSSRSRISYLYDPAYPDRWNNILDDLNRRTEAGADGIWIDILMASTLGDSDIGGTRWLGDNAESEPGDLFVWDFTNKRLYRREEFRRRTEINVRMIQEQYLARTGKPALIYGNNMYYTEFIPEGGSTWKYMASTPEKPVPIAGMCIEDYMGGYTKELWSEYSRQGKIGPPGKASLGTHEYRNWRHNQGILASCAQRGLPAVPLIINAGMKTAIFEKLDRPTRHEWERWAYASYLLCVEIKDGKCPTKLGVPMFYFDNGKRHVDIDAMYRWPIGTPAETKPADRFDDYKLPGTGVYARRFSNGLVIVNPELTPAKITLPEALLNPDTGATITTLTVAPQSGHILLKTNTQ